jgi:dipeptidyl aminopeptidase/acylaminoacyl peptidase
MNCVKRKVLFLLSAMLLPSDFNGQLRTPDSGLWNADSGLRAQTSYQKPPKIIQDILDAPATPLVSVSPARDRILLIETPNYPSIADLSQPMLRLAGLRINPDTNGPYCPHHLMRVIGLTLKNIESGKDLKIRAPAQPRMSVPEWSSDGKQFVFTNTVAKGIELWVGDAATGQVRHIPGVALNGAYADPVRWMPDSRTLVCLTVVAGRGDPPLKSWQAPKIQESYGRQTPEYQNLLQNPHDEALFEFYATSQIVLVDTFTAGVTNAGEPAVVSSVEPSPDGEHLLVVTTRKPYSYLLPASAFPKEVEVWNRTGRVEYRLASLPLSGGVPIDGVPVGPRSYGWRPTEPATLVWVEALDGGDPKRRAPHRDRILMLPFGGRAVEIAKTELRFRQIIWSERNGLAILIEGDRDKMRSLLIDADDRLNQPRMLGRMWGSRSLMGRNGYPGEPLMKVLPNGHRVMLQHGDYIYFKGEGPGRPFLARYDLTTWKSETLFQCDDQSYESVIELLEDDASRFITRYESPRDPPNYFIRTPDGAPFARRALTTFRAPHASLLRGIRKQVVTYQRDDGQKLSFTLYLPPDYKEGVRLPTVLWVYPQEFADAGKAGQVYGSNKRFMTISGPSHLLFALLGYAVLDSANMPIVGRDLQTVNDTYLEQIVAGAEAAVNKAVGMGVTDRNRVGVGGHSYGAFMVANLLAHSDIFRAGIARSGAYNRTFTPFGFQNERRTLWEAPEMYLKVSPFMLAHKIREPILLIHGENDDNVAAMQSERMYQAIKGNGGNARYVSLPFESHGYQARESVEHVLWEMISWFDKHVKQPRGNAATPVN